jgi:uncharacterized phage infection (PIP) family protein YhgE
MEKMKRALSALNENSAALQAVALLLMVPVLIVLVGFVLTTGDGKQEGLFRAEAVAAGHAYVEEGRFRWLPPVREYETKMEKMQALVDASEAYVNDLEKIASAAENRAEVMAKDLDGAMRDLHETSEALANANEYILTLEAEVAKREAVDTLETVDVAEVIEADLKALEEADKAEAGQPADREEEANEPPKRKKKKWFEFWKKRE